MNTDHLTTAAGGTVALTIFSQVNLAKLLSGDQSEIAKLISAVAMFALAWFTNKQAKP